MDIKYEWDENKRRATLDERQLDFAAVSHIFEWDTATIISSDRDGESRWIAYGYVGDRLYALLYTHRDSNRRIISFRRANLKEVNQYG